MTAYAVCPLFSLSDVADSLVMDETISTPGAISSTTIELMGPFLMLLTFPERTLRALIFMFYLGRFSISNSAP